MVQAVRGMEEVREGVSAVERLPLSDVPDDDGAVAAGAAGGKHRGRIAWVEVQCLREEGMIEKAVRRQFLPELVNIQGRREDGRER